MRSIDVHAHLMPQSLWAAVDSGGNWYGVRHETDGEGQGWLVNAGRRTGPLPSKARFTPQERIADMDSLGVDVHVVSVAPTLFSYHLESSQAVRAAREVNDEIASMTRTWPDRFAGLATLPLPNIDASIAELERSVHRLGLLGGEVGTVVNQRNWDEPEFFPLFQAAERMGALLFFHPSDSLVRRRTNQYHLINTIGNTAEDTLVVATLIFGGILERCPNLKEGMCPALARRSIAAGAIPRISNLLNMQKLLGGIRPASLRHANALRAYRM